MSEVVESPEIDPCPICEGLVGAIRESSFGGLRFLNCARCKLELYHPDEETLVRLWNRLKGPRGAVEIHEGNA